MVFSGRTSMPGVFIEKQQIGNALMLGALAFGAHQTEHHVGELRRVMVQIFWPLMTKSRAVFHRARSAMDARSEPAPGSE